MTSRCPPRPVLADDRFATAVTAGALRRIEDAGPLDDVVAMQRALALGGDRAQQIARRNALLAERLGLLQALARWRLAGGWLILALALLMALAGLAAARSVLAPDRSINAVAAVVGVLALPTLTLLPWLLGLALSWRQPSLGSWSFGRFLLSLLAHLPLAAGAHAPQLLQALLDLMRRQRLWSWFSGVVGHAVWFLALLLTVLRLWFAFAFQTYSLSWETTILSSAFFQQLVAVSGWLPHALGFAVPDADAVRQVATAAAGTLDPSVQRAWAWWVMGCIVVYGLLPRLLLLLLSLWRWRRGVSRLVRVDMSDPYNQQLVRRFDALEPASRVVDAERRARTAGARGERSSSAVDGTAPAIVGFELPDELPWPQPDLPHAALLHVDGSAAAREQARQQLAAAPPPALLVLVHGPASPDRGVARFLRELMQLVPRCAVLPLHSDGSAAAPEAVSRWRDWLRAEDLPGLAILPQPAAAVRWLAPPADAEGAGHG